MRNVLADLALESEAATVLGMRLAAAYDAAEGGGEDAARERALLRIAVPVAKYWVTKRCTPVVTEALECLGGNGYVEESGMPRLLRESPLNSVWEGSGNVQALDVVRVLRTEPLSLDAFCGRPGRRGARTTASTGRYGTCSPSWRTWTASRRGRGASWSGWPWCSRGAARAVGPAGGRGRVLRGAARRGRRRGFGTLPHTLDLRSVVERARVEV